MKNKQLILVLVSILCLSVIQPVSASYYFEWSDSTGYSHYSQSGGTVNHYTGMMSAERTGWFSSTATLEIGDWFTAPQSGGYFKVGVAWNSDYKMTTGWWSSARMKIEYILRDPSNGIVLETHTVFEKSIGEYDSMYGTDMRTTETQILFRYSLVQGKAYIVAVRVTWSGSYSWTLHDHTGASGTSGSVDINMIIVRRT